MDELTRITNTLASRQAVPRNFLLPKNLSAVRNAPHPSNSLYGRPRVATQVEEEEE